ncbi:MAG: preprotein translocase subunit SecY [Candidatus Altiarchaeales archaeon IMC4]|nr:MAG: preprotein translocase subunit SecY [Candidatus Altiarchaeales archaeon IMC4]
MKIEFMRPFIKHIPEVELPKRHIAFKEKLLWTGAALLLFFIMGVVYPWQVDETDLAQHIQGFEVMKMIFASSMGSIISLGIGPIVTASIVLQLLVGAKMIDIDLSKNEDKALFQGTQKILTIIIAIFEAAALVITTQIVSGGGLIAFTVFQIALGSILLMYMDEIVSKWGIGSGIGLFIAGGVSQTIINGTISFIPKDVGGFYGAIPTFIGGIMNGALNLNIIFPVIATLVVFLIVVFFEAMRLEIPLSYGGIRGVGGRYPLKFFYVSNIPVILAAALLMNAQMLPNMVGIAPGNTGELSTLQYVVDRFTYYVTLGELNGIIGPGSWQRLLDTSVLIHLLVYMLVFVGLCILFGKFWVETTGMGSERVADQIERGGMQIPGFRRDKRIVKKVLDRYIPQITIISSVAVGLLAVGADIIGALGGGTGILLTVGILYRTYEQIQKEQMADMHPAFRRFMGKG